jgi:hypothetical protein
MKYDIEITNTQDMSIAPAQEPSYSSNGLVRSFNGEEFSIPRVMHHFRDMPEGFRVLLATRSMNNRGNPEKFTTYFQLLVKESQSHWVRVDENDETNPNVAWDAEFLI